MYDLVVHDNEVYDWAVRIGLAWRELRRGAATSDLRDFLYGHGEESIEQGQMDTLDVLVHRPSWRMSDLAEALRVDPSTATRAVQRLLKEHLAERGTDADDGRVVTVFATDEGRRLHARVDERRGFVITKLMSAFSVDERGLLAELMTRFVRELDELVKELPNSADADAQNA